MQRRLARSGPGRPPDGAEREPDLRRVSCTIRGGSDPVEPDPLARPRRRSSRRSRSVARGRSSSAPTCSISPVATPSRAAAGVTQRCAATSSGANTGSASGGRSATKNQVENRRGMKRGVVQWAIGTSRSRPVELDAGLLAELADAPRDGRRAPASGGEVVAEGARGRAPSSAGVAASSASSGSTRPPGNTWRPGAERHRGRPLDQEHLGPIRRRRAGGRPSPPGPGATAGVRHDRDRRARRAAPRARPGSVTGRRQAKSRQT